MIFLILFFNFTILYWFCHISTWIRHRYTRVPHPEPSSLLPLRTIPLFRRIVVLFFFKVSSLKCLILFLVRFVNLSRLQNSFNIHFHRLKRWNIIISSFLEMLSGFWHDPDLLVRPQSSVQCAPCVYRCPGQYRIFPSSDLLMLDIALNTYIRHDMIIQSWGWDEWMWSLSVKKKIRSYY